MVSMLVPAVNERRRYCYTRIHVRFWIVAVWCCISILSSASLHQAATASEDILAESATASNETSSSLPLVSTNNNNASSSNNSNVNDGSDDLQRERSSQRNSTTYNQTGEEEDEESNGNNNTTTPTPVTTTTTTTTLSPSQPLHLRDRISTWKLPSMWTASWNETVITDDDEEDVRYDDDKTYLDIFGQVAKEFLTQRVIPSTDPECDWNWKHLRCEPFCHCDLFPLWGDYHIGRSCRRRRDGPQHPLYRALYNESMLRTTSPALAPCSESAGDLLLSSSPLKRAQHFLQLKLELAEPITKASVDWWQQQLKQLLQSQQYIQAQSTTQAWVKTAQFKLNKWQTHACENVPCRAFDDDYDDDDNDVTIPDEPQTTEHRRRRRRLHPGPLVWSQRFLCENLPFAEYQCTAGDDANTNNKQGTFRQDEERVFDFNSSVHSKKKKSSSSQQPAAASTSGGAPQQRSPLPPPTQQQKQRPTFHRFAGWSATDD